MSLNMNDIEQMIKTHMDNQPYRIECDCGEVLNSTTEVDRELDLTIKVEPCIKCRSVSSTEGESS